MIIEGNMRYVVIHFCLFGSAWESYSIYVNFFWRHSSKSSILETVVTNGTLNISGFLSAAIISLALFLVIMPNTFLLLMLLMFELFCYFQTKEKDDI